jgi:glycosyltransferase involved in cell wall biosynthesis
MRLSLASIGRPRRRATAGPINVCFVIDSLNRAGTESQLLALIQHLDRDRVRPSLCLLHPESPESASLRPDCPTLSIGLRKLMSLASPLAAAKLVAFWRRQRVQVVQTYFRDSTYFATPLARAAGIRHLVRVRNNVGYWLTPLDRLLSRLVGRLGVTLTNSEQARQAVVEAEELEQGRIRVIENGVDVERFQNTARSRPADGRVRVGTVANLRPVKNIDGLIRVASAVCREWSHVDFHVAGDGEQRAELERQVAANGLGGRFFLHGSVADVPQFLAELDIAVLSSHSESMSNSLLEFMAAGKPIVATDVGANASVVRHGIDGVIVPRRDDAALADGIRKLLMQPLAAQRHGNSARERVATEFSRERMVRRFEDFYETLVKRSDPRR